MLLRPLVVALAPADADPSPTARIPGHQLAAVVEALASDLAPNPAHRALVGQRVAVNPSIACAACDTCRAGLSAHCPRRVTLGIDTPQGALAERLALPLRQIVPLPAHVSDELAALAWPVARAIHAAQIAAIQGKPYVTILGDAPEALLAAQVMARLNASVRLLGTDPARFTLCERWGIKHRHASEVGRHADQDLVIDTTADAASLELATRLARPRGKIVLMPPLRAQGPTAPPPTPAPLHALAGAELQLLGVRTGSIADAVALLATGEIDALPMIAARRRLADARAAIEQSRQPGQLLVLVELAALDRQRAA